MQDMNICIRNTLVILTSNLLIEQCALDRLSRTDSFRDIDEVVLGAQAKAMITGFNDPIFAKTSEYAEAAKGLKVSVWVHWRSHLLLTHPIVLLTCQCVPYISRVLRRLVVT
jgi:hypothetical protein